MISDVFLKSLEKETKETDKAEKELPPPPTDKVPIFIKESELKIYSRIKLLNLKWVRMNRLMGNPIHPGTGLSKDVTLSQLAYHAVWKLYHRVAYNKSRKRGATEASLRTVLECCFDEYRGHKVAMISGNRQSQADDYLTRFDDLLWGPNDKGFTDALGEHWKYSDLVSHKTHNTLKMQSGVEIETFPGDEFAVRGLENIKCVLFIEAAHIPRAEDKKIYTAVHPLAANDDKMDFILETTPNGKRGFFYNNFINKKNEYFKLEYDYKSAIEEGLMTQKFIDSEMHNPEIDWEQEYCCKFTTSNSGAFNEDMINKIYQPERRTVISDILKKNQP